MGGLQKESGRVEFKPPKQAFFGETYRRHRAFKATTPHPPAFEYRVKGWLCWVDVVGSNTSHDPGNIASLLFGDTCSIWGECKKGLSCRVSIEGLASVTATFCAELLRVDIVVTDILHNGRVLLIMDMLQIDHQTQDIYISISIGFNLAITQSSTLNIYSRTKHGPQSWLVGYLILFTLSQPKAQKKPQLTPQDIRDRYVQSTHECDTVS